jgi:hypothetical protein
VKVVVIVVAVLVIVALAVLLLRQGNPEETATHGGPPDDSDSERFYRGVERPAGPDAEDQSPDGLSAGGARSGSGEDAPPTPPVP